MKDPFGDQLQSDEFQNENESKEAHAAAQAKRKKFQKFEADNPGAHIHPDGEWREIRSMWHDANEQEREDLIYGAGYHNFAKPKDFAAMYGIKQEELKAYNHLFLQAQAVLKFKIQNHNLRWAFTTNQPMAKFNMAQQYAGQVANPAHNDVESLDDARNAPTMTVRVLSKTVEVDTKNYDDDEADDSYGGNTLQ